MVWQIPPFDCLGYTGIYALIVAHHEEEVAAVHNLLLKRYPDILKLAPRLYLVKAFNGIVTVQGSNGIGNICKYNQFTSVLGHCCNLYNSP